MNDTTSDNPQPPDPAVLRPTFVPPPSYSGFKTTVILAGAFVGATFGSLGDCAGLLVGALGGVLAGIIWVRAMLRHSRRGCGRGTLVLAGGAWGIVVGLFATAVLHAGLMLLHPGYQHWLGGPQATFVLAVFSGTLGGVVTGALCGLIVPIHRRPCQ